MLELKHYNQFRRLSLINVKKYKVSAWCLRLKQLLIYNDLQFKINLVYSSALKKQVSKMLLHQRQQKSKEQQKFSIL